MEKEPEAFLYGIAWSVLGVMAVIIFTQVIIYIKEKLSKGGEERAKVQEKAESLNTGLILKEIQILRIENSGEFKLMQKTQETIEKNVEDLKKQMEQKDKKWEDVDLKLDQVINEISGFQTKLKSLEQSYVTLEYRIINIENGRPKTKRPLNEKI